MPELPFASVVVPAHNEERHIGACVASLLALDYPPQRYEVIVVENGSTDATAKALEAFDGRIRVLRRAGANGATARNAGLEAVSGEVVAFLDADCAADPGWLRAMVAPLVDRDLVVVAGDVRAPPDADWVERFGDLVHDQRAAVGYDPPYASTASCAMAVAPLRADGGGFDDTLELNSDVDLSYRLHERGWSFIHQPDAVVCHRGGPDSLWALFRLGARHGHHSIPCLQLHAPMLRRMGLRRWSWSPLSDVARGVLGLARAPSRAGLCELIFVTGKLIGKVTGVARSRLVSS